MPTAYLLIAHGSRRPEANDELVQLAGQVRARRPEAIVEVAYLELAEPTIAAAAERCVRQGAAEVRLLPYFLSPGVHVTRDLEECRSRLATEFAPVKFVLCPPLGDHSLILDVVLDRLQAHDHP